MPAYFVTGTGTGIGKTFVTTALCQQLKEHRKEVFAIKPVITGWTDNPDNNDTLQILDALSLIPTPENIDKVTPWRYAAPLAPNMAAAKENKTIVFRDVVRFCKKAIKTYSNDERYLFIEGAGGIMSPLTNEKTYLDLMKVVGIPAIIVSGSYLGSISHTLTAVEVLKYHRIPLKHIIISESLDSDGPSLADMNQTLSHFLHRSVVYLPRLMKPQARFWTALLDLTNILED